MYQPKEREQEILDFWQEKNIFERSVSERPEDNNFVFYDGPPFATGLPHYGHLMAGTKKDAIPRYQTMRGKRVNRRWGWDCHGLPIENLIEKELGLSGPKAIREYGVAKFNEACRAKVLEYADEWEKVVPRFGRFVDMKNPYKTMDLSFMESVWWVFAELYKRDLIYEGKKPMHVCPRCVTPLSNFEVAQGYKDIKDLSVIAKFQLDKNSSAKLGLPEEKTFILAWTTTPWTLPGNVLLAVNSSVRYSVFSSDKFPGEVFVAASDRIEDLRKKISGEVNVISEHDGSDFVGLGYEPLFPYYAERLRTENGLKIVTGEFVSTEDGTGIVHIAPAFGADDYALAESVGAPFVSHVSMEGRFLPEVADFAGEEVKPTEDHTRTDVLIIKWLAGAGKLFFKEKYEHSYPHCWRCDTPLLNYATSSWFVKVTAFQKEMIDNNEKTNWIPEHVKHGRFGKWLEGVRDWSISRNRFWGTPIPVWQSESGKRMVISSAAELSELSGQAVVDLHKHIVDEISFVKDGEVYKRVSEVLDTWFDSGCVPYGEAHFPFENKEKFANRFPADYIAESQDQTRGWFYTLHAIATGLTLENNSALGLPASSAFKTVSMNGMILAEDGRKMSKRLKNYPDPIEMVEKYGADSLRFYFLSSPVMEGETLLFSEKSVKEIYGKIINTFSNVLAFYELFADKQTGKQEKSVLDQWITSRLSEVRNKITESLERHDILEASRYYLPFLDDLSTWYVRRSRERVKHGTSEEATSVVATLEEVLLNFSRLLAPFCPFFAEHVYQTLKRYRADLSDSVHLDFWPEESEINETVLKEMAFARELTELGLSIRKEAGVRVRQPLLSGVLSGCFVSPEYLEIAKEELNLLELVCASELPGGQNWTARSGHALSFALDLSITPELKKIGLSREIVRTINQLRKEKSLTVHDRALLHFATKDAELETVFKESLSEILTSTRTEHSDNPASESVTVDIDGKSADISLTLI